MTVSNEALVERGDGVSPFGAFAGDKRAKLFHELRSPIGTLACYADLLVELLEGQECPSDEVLWALAPIRRSTARVVALLDDLQLCSRLERSVVEARRELVSVDDLCRDAAGRWTDRAAAADLTLAVEARRGLVVEGDAALLADALDRLLENAVHYSRRGGTIAVTSGEHGSGRVRIEVVDDGIGIPCGERSQVVEPFARGSNVRENHGPGMGLTIAAAVAAGHGGCLRLLSPGLDEGGPGAASDPASAPPGLRVVLELPRSDHRSDPDGARPERRR